MSAAFDFDLGLEFDFQPATQRQKRDKSVRPTRELGQLVDGPFVLTGANHHNLRFLRTCCTSHTGH